MFNRILIGVKFSDTSRYALERAVELAETHDSDLHILHVMDYRLTALKDDDPELHTSQARARDFFDQELKPMTAGLKRVEFNSLPGDPAMAVCRNAMDIAADLIILGCHKRPDEEPIVRVDYVGSTILEKSPCPVLLVPLIE